MRAKARAEGRFARYDGRWRDRDPSEAPAGHRRRRSASRRRSDGETVIDDRVQGRVAFPNKDLDDFVILRSDGTPTYMLAVVVDDHDMGVTHIIRGDDHLTNAARQKIIYDAIGWHVPVMAHIPLIHGPDGAKLSKRHGALGVEAYRAMGYLPEAMRNYLVRLGWSHGDDEIMSTREMIDWFDIDGIGKSPARFDFAKLENLNAHYMRADGRRRPAGDADRRAAAPAGGAAFAAKLDPTRRGAARRRACRCLKERAKTLVELIDGAAVPRRRAAARRSTTAARSSARRRGAARCSPASLPALADGRRLDRPRRPRRRSRRSPNASGVKLGKVAQPLRAALTGRTASPGIFDVLAVLGREESLGAHRRPGHDLSVRPATACLRKAFRRCHSGLVAPQHME